MAKKSITIIDKTKPPAPFFTYQPVPTNFKNTLEEERYWQTEKKRWHEGYGDLTGALYWYASQVKLKNRLTGEIMRPEVRDADIIIFNAIEEARKKGQFLFFIKARGIGFSSIGMALPFYYFLTSPGCNCVATSKDKKTLSTLFRDKTMIAFRHLKNPYVKFDQISKNETSTDSHLTVGRKYLTKQGEEDYAESNFYCRDTQERDTSTTAFSGTGALYGFADEAPLMQRLNPFLRSTVEIFTDHSTNRIVGTLVMGGTCEDTIKAEDIQRIQYLWENAQAQNILPLFLPDTYGKHTVNGHSDLKRAEEENLKKREELDKLEDKLPLRSHIKNHPLTLDEIFELGKGGGFDDYTVEKINEQAKVIVREKFPIHTYSLIDEGVGKMKAEPNPDSKLQILEHPKPGVKYTLGVDGIMTSDLTSSDEKSKKSEFAVVVMKGADLMSDIQFGPVAIYHERPKGIDICQLKTLDLLKYYNQYNNAIIQGELNAAGENLLKSIINNGLKSTVGMRKDQSGKGYVNKKEMWVYRNDPVKNWQQEAANIYFKKYSSMVRFSEIIKDAQKSMLENRDLLDALMLCLYEWMTGDPMEQKQTKTKVYKTSYVKGWQNGVPIWEHVEYTKTS